MNLARAFAYTRYLEEEVSRLRSELRDWQDKTLERRGISPLGAREPEADTSGTQGFALDLRPPIARAQAEWEAADERKRQQGLTDEQKDRLRGAAAEVFTN
jgi:hypothetical protein